MEKIKIELTEWSNITQFILRYFEELSWNNDLFHNSMMLDGTAYSVFIDNIECGFFSLMDSWESGKMLTSFYISPEKRRYSEEIFESVCSRYDISAALAASNDHHFISIAFEKMHFLGTSFEMQAYNFVYGEPAVKAVYGMEYMEEVFPEEFEQMNELTEKQWDGCFSSDDYQFYKIVKSGKVLGYGAIGKMRYNSVCVDVGNFTLPEYRQEGVGRSMIINLSNIALNQGYKPVAGCWYGNKNSVLTLKSSGYIPENRIFYIRLK